MPLAIGAEGAELAEGVGVGLGPPGAGFFEPGLQDVFMATFDQAGTDGQVVRERVGVIELFGAILQVAQRGALARGQGNAPADVN